MNFNQYSDKELLILLSKGKPESDYAFTELYNRYSDEVYRFCLFLTGDRSLAEDIFQETFIKYLAKNDHNSDVVNVKAYLITTAKHLYINKNRQTKFVNLENIEELISDDHKSIDNKELTDLIFNALELLDVQYKEAFILRVIEGLSYKEMAEIMNISWSGAQSRTVRAKEKIVNILSPYINDLKNNL